MGVIDCIEYILGSCELPPLLVSRLQITQPVPLSSSTFLDIATIVGIYVVICWNIESPCHRDLFASVTELLC
jgi:hypothetical protein